MAVQLIDLQGDQLVKRGLIEHEVRQEDPPWSMRDPPFQGEVCFAWVEDRDHPRVQSELELLKVDQLFAFEEYHIELNRGSLWSPASSSIRVVSVANDTAALSRIPSERIMFWVLNSGATFLHPSGKRWSFAPGPGGRLQETREQIHLRSLISAKCPR